MNYQETLDYMFQHLPMYQRIGAAAYKKDLGNTLALCAHLGNPQHQFLSVHVGGTNGKGSTSHLIASVLQAAGFKTGLYVSPHYKDFRERIKVNGQYIKRSFIVDFIAQNQAFLEELEPSFFEMTVGLAFDYFAKEKVDIAVVEVGLGGRLDSTNVLSPLVSVITNISYDHVNMLGDTLPLIAGEKAGIIKTNTPIIIGEKQEEVLPVFEAKAKEMNAPLSIANVELSADLVLSEKTKDTYHIFKDNNILLEYLDINIKGAYQQKNILTALHTCLVLNTLSITKDKLDFNIIRTGFGNLQSMTRFMGRWQYIGHAPDILCDSAHNEGGLRLAMSELTQLSYEKLHIIMGFVNDKDIDKVLSIFPREATYYFAKANIPRGLPAIELKAKAAEKQLHGRAYSSVKNALKAAKRNASSKDLIYVGGSIFVVGEVL